MVANMAVRIVEEYREGFIYRLLICKRLTSKFHDIGKLGTASLSIHELPEKTRVTVNIIYNCKCSMI